MKYFTITLAFLISMTFGVAAFAQPPSTPEATETIVNWRNLEGAVSRLIQAYEAKAAELAALNDYWAKYVAGLTPHK